MFASLERGKPFKESFEQALKETVMKKKVFRRLCGRVLSRRFVNTDGTEIKVELDDEYNLMHVYNDSLIDESLFWYLLQQNRISVWNPRKFVLIFYLKKKPDLLPNGFYKSDSNKYVLVKYGWTEFRVRYEYYNASNQKWTVTFRFGSMSYHTMATIAGEIRLLENMKPFRKEPIFFEETKGVYEDSLLSEFITRTSSSETPIRIVFSNKPNDGILFF